jgi:23S rRNA pseudouridine2605 synthase
MEHLGLKVSRLIRVSFGPFHLGHLPEGAVEEIPGKVWREQLGIAKEKKKTSPLKKGRSSTPASGRDD